MIIESNIKDFIIFSEESILNALKKISDNKCRIIFCVSESGVLESVLTDGDFRRWLLREELIELNISVANIANKYFCYSYIDDDLDKISSLFSDSIEVIPLLDNKKHLVAIARKKTDEIQIGDFVISEFSETFIIAEIGNNHNGCMKQAKKLIDLAAESGAHCAKFQMRDLSSLYANSGNTNDISEDLGSQYTLDLLSKFQLSRDDMFSCFDYCKEKNIIPLCTPWDIESLKALEKYGMLSYKVASADLTNHDLLNALARTNKPLICSTGMSTENEIIESVNLLRKLGAKFILLHCNSTYPTPFKDINLNYINKLKNITSSFVGYSGHERGINIAIAAVAKGAKIIEKHFTIDRNMEGNDHKVSLLPEEFKCMVKGIKEIEDALGTNSNRRLSQGEFINREILAKSLVINCDLNIGDIISENMIEVKSPGKGLQPNKKKELIGMKASRKLKKGDFFFESDIFEERIGPRKFSFNRSWGIPVRYHDYKDLIQNLNPDVLEFHLSYKDLDVKCEQFIGCNYNMNLIVHAPELFSNDHLLDLCSINNEYRNISIQHLNKVIKVTENMSKFFKNDKKPLIVTNVGGFSTDGHITSTKKYQLYSLLIDSLSKLNSNNVEIIFQTMPPFPWHFGGQRYHNVFVNYQEIINFCKEYSYRICLDISHTKLACNYFKWSFKEFIEMVGSYVAHLHIADSKGIDGEGLQIGDGDIDFKALSIDLNKYAPNAPFIPEIWQGHKNKGEGFWRALDKLEKFQF